VLAQRLVRRVCDACRVSYEPKPESVAAVAGRPVGRRSLVRGAGCAACRGTGFKGRLGIFELMVMSDELKDAIAHRATRTQLRALAVDAGLTPLRGDGWAKAEAGLTTVEEVLRVVQD
jgi:type II secretory ATPase GspE/PulE/Tfp pilus assembly ATPase PilB-like protein